ncbi:MAG: tRNA (guanosine(37)-N1)-methyltransferase TrmD [Chloroflexota bacterium]
MNAIHFDIFTLFPQMFAGPFSESILKRALERSHLSMSLHNIRDFTTDRHRLCDDTPYGGGGGMVMKPEPITRAVETVLSHPPRWTLAEWQAAQHGEQASAEPTAESAIHTTETGIALPLPAWNADQRVSEPKPKDTSVLLMSPQGQPLNQSLVAELSQYKRLAIICGRYEGVDERVRTQLVDREISLGDFVISGGELAAMVVVDAVARLIPGVLGYKLSADQDSHSPGLDGLLEGPHYTRPATFRNETVPDVLLSGHHANIDKWRREQALLRTRNNRPDLLERLSLSDSDYAFLESI